MVDLAALGLGDVGGAERPPSPGGEGQRLLHEALIEGSLERSAGILISLYLSGWSVAEIIDGPLRGAMREIGEIWLRDESGIYREHLATDIATQSLTRLRYLLPADHDRALAVGGLLSGDRHLLAAAAVATVLQGEGLRTVNLGADTPVDSVILGAEELQADLVWLSVTNAESVEQLSADIARLLAALEARGVPLVVGGARVEGLALPDHQLLHAGSSMSDLSALIGSLGLGGKSAVATSAR